MAWLSNFLIGRPGYEYTIDVNYDVMTPTWNRMGATMRSLSGQLYERVYSVNVPVVKIKSNWLSKSGLDTFMTLLTVTDTFLSFRTRNGDWNILSEPNIALTVSTIQLQNSPITRLSAALVAAGFSSQITINHVYALPENTAGGQGTDYYTGGSYSDATNTITLGSNLPSIQQAYISYSFSGWLVQLNTLNTTISGGRVDLFTQDFVLTGA